MVKKGFYSLRKYLADQKKRKSQSQVAQGFYLESLLSKSFTALFQNKKDKLWGKNALNLSEKMFRTNKKKKIFSLIFKNYKSAKEIKWLNSTSESFRKQKLSAHFLEKIRTFKSRVSKTQLKFELICLAKKDKCKSFVFEILQTFWENQKFRNSEIILKFEKIRRRKAFNTLAKSLKMHYQKIRNNKLVVFKLFLQIFQMTQSYEKNNKVVNFIIFESLKDFLSQIKNKSQMIRKRNNIICQKKYLKILRKRSLIRKFKASKKIERTEKYFIKIQMSFMKKIKNRNKLKKIEKQNNKKLQILYFSKILKNYKWISNKMKITDKTIFFIKEKFFNRMVTRYNSIKEKINYQNKINDTIKILKQKNLKKIFRKLKASIKDNKNKKNFHRKNTQIINTMFVRKYFKTFCKKFENRERIFKLQENLLSNQRKKIIKKFLKKMIISLSVKQVYNAQLRKAENFSRIHTLKKSLIIFSKYTQYKIEKRMTINNNIQKIKQISKSIYFKKVKLLTIVRRGLRELRDISHKQIKKCSLFKIKKYCQIKSKKGYLINKRRKKNFKRNYLRKIQNRAKRKIILENIMLIIKKNYPKFLKKTAFRVFELNKQRSKNLEDILENYLVFKDNNKRVNLFIL